MLDSSDMEGAFTIKWDFYTELREWGVKNIGVYATSIEGVVFKNDECVDDSERTVVNSEDKGWRITSDTSNINFGDCIEPQDVWVDLKRKEFIVNF